MVKKKSEDVESAKALIKKEAADRCNAAIADYNKAVDEIKKKYNVQMIHIGQYSMGKIQNYISFIPSDQ